MGCTVQAGKVGYIKGSPLDARLVPASKPAEACEQQHDKPVCAKKRKRKQTRAAEVLSDSASTEPESPELLSSSEEVDESTLSDSSVDHQDMKMHEVQL